jgi:CheY-like chemotaxis protein
MPFKSTDCSYVYDETNPQKKNMRKFKVCLIEDDAAFLYLAKMIIQSVDSDVEIMTYPDGAPAFAFFQEHMSDIEALPDLILLDLNMPRLDGWGFLDKYETIKESMVRSIPIYILSSSISERDIERSWTIPSVSDFITKPLEESKFAEILSTLRK